MGRIIDTYRAAFSGLPRDVWALAAIALVNRAGTMVLPFLALYLTREEGLSPMQAGRLLGLYGLGSVAGAYVGGRLADRIGTTRAQQASLIGAGIGFVILSAVEGQTAIALAVLGLSVVGESFRPANMAAFAERAPEALQARALALLRLAINVGMTLGPAAGGVLAVLSYKWLFYADAATCWLAAALLFALPPLPDRPASEESRSGQSLLLPARDGAFVLFLLLVFSVSAVFFQIASTLPLTLHDVYLFRESVIGALLALNALIIVVFEMVLIHWAETRDRLALIGIGSLLVCLGFGMMPLGTGVSFAALTIVVWTVGEMLCLPLMNAVTAGRATPQTRGRYMGLYGMSFSLAFVVGPAAGTYVYERFGPDVLWFGVAALGPPMLIGALLLRGPMSRRQR